jgi:hypothetical protein
MEKNDAPIRCRATMYLLFFIMGFCSIIGNLDAASTLDMRDTASVPQVANVSSDRFFLQAEVVADSHLV